MPPKAAKEAPLTQALTDRLNDLTARHLSTADDGSETATTVDEWKALGNACFSNQSYLTAIKCYSKAIADLPGGDTAVLRSNRSAAYLKSSMFSGPAMALKDAERAVELEPKWFKSYMRVGDAQFSRKKYDEAEAAYTRALRLDPVSAAAAAASLKEVKKEKFLRDLDLQDRERRRAEEETYDRLREATGVEDPAWTAASVNATLNTTYRPHDGDAAEEMAKKPLEFHNAPLFFGAPDTETAAEELLYGTGAVDGTRRRGPPTESETEQLIRAWKQDLVPMEDDEVAQPHSTRGNLSNVQGRPSLTSSPATTAMTTTTTASASRGAGVAYKERLMGQFRTKVEADVDFSESLQARRAEDLKKGEVVNYREADRFRKVYERSTNGIGLGISTDAYKEHTGKETSRW